MMSRSSTAVAVQEAALPSESVDNAQIHGRPSAGFLIPRNFEEALKIGEFLAKTNLVPAHMRGKPTDIVIALQMGLELGLAPMQALQSIAVINGVPKLWGDTPLGMVQAHSSFISFDEGTENESTPQAKGWATLTRTGKNGGPNRVTTRTFTRTQADLAKLTKKEGPHTEYPDRMLQMRARGFCLRDGASDILKGMAAYDEMPDTIDYETGEVLPSASALQEAPRPVSKVALLRDRLAVTEDTPIETGDSDKSDVSASDSVDAGSQQSLLSDRLEAPEIPDPKSMKDEALGVYIVDEARRLGLFEADIQGVVRDFGGKMTRSNFTAVITAMRGHATSKESPS